MFHLPTDEGRTSNDGGITPTIGNTRMEVETYINGFCDRVTPECQG